MSKSYASAVGGFYSVLFASSLQSTILKDDTFSKKLNEEVYTESLTLCWHSFIARVRGGTLEAPRLEVASYHSVEPSKLEAYFSWEVIFTSFALLKKKKK